MTQKVPGRVQVGDSVRVRGDDWQVAGVAPGGRCVAVTLIGATPANRGRRSVLLMPFDRPQRLPVRRLARRVTWPTWLHAARTLVATGAPADRLRAAAGARVLLLPRQLEPALAAVRGLGSRFLLADGVGLGKTVQAGLLLAELQVRGLADRSLVLTPPGLRDQWIDELRERFDIEATLVDRQFVRSETDRFALDVNPWQLPVVAVASLDYAKRSDIAPSVIAVSWDLLIVDEAHAVTPGSDRAAFVDALASRTRRVVLLTATPHPGDPAAFAHLCEIGALSDGPVLLFRRTRRDVGPPAVRHATLLPVAPTAAERRMHRLLAGYTRAVWAGAPAARRPDALLVLAILNKRALSSARSLERSVTRRLTLLEGEADPAEEPTQLALEFEVGEADVEDAAPRALGRPALSDSAHERRHLRALRHAAARAAAGGESKIAALRRLLRRAAEPALVFTEYRDTLAWLAEGLTSTPTALLHGGLTRRERHAAAHRFATGRARLLLATDAAGEGLNLQACCRLVINLELPWMPRRLEQRIGRVDRIGQRRTVHAVHLLARGTGEADVLARLVRRQQRIRTALGDAGNPPGFPSEADLVGTLSSALPTAAVEADVTADSNGPAVERDAVPDNAAIRRIDLRADAAAEVSRLRAVRWIRDGAVPGAQLAAGNMLHSRAALDRRWPWFAEAPARRLRMLPGPGLLCLCRYRIVTGPGAVVEEDLVPLWLALDARIDDGTGPPLRLLVERTLETYDTAIRPLVDRLVARRLDALRATHTSALRHAAGRDQTIAAHADASAALSARLVQQGLFDRRAVRDAERRLRRQAADRATWARRRAATEAACRLRLAAPPEPVLILHIASFRPPRPR